MKGKLTVIADKLVWIAIVSGALFWILEAILHVLIFQEGTVIQHIFSPRPHEIWMRLIVVAAFIAFAVYAQFIIIQRKRAEEATKHAYAELNQIFNTAADGMSVVDKDFNVLRVNETFSTLTGIRKEETVGKKCYEVFRGPMCHTQQCPLIQILGGKGLVECDVEKQRNDGVKVPCIVTATPFVGPGGELVGIVEDFKDISERKRAEEALQEAHYMLEQRVEERTAELARTTEQLKLELSERKQAEEAQRESEERYRAVFEGAAEGILITDIETMELKYANPALCRMLGYTEEQMKQMSVRDIHPKESLEHVISEFKAQARGEKMLAPSVPCLKGDGTTLYADINTTRVLIDQRECNVGFFIDITERKRTEEALRESEEKYRNLFNSTNDAMFVYHPTPEGMPGKFVEVDDVACNRYGYTREELLNLSPLDLSAPEDLQNIPVRQKKLFAEKHIIFEKIQVTKEGRRIPVEISSHLFNLNDRHVVLSAVRDITKRKRAEEHIRTLTQELIKAQESERQRISRDLHDRVAQDLSTLKIGLDTLFDNQPGGPPETRRTVPELSKMLQETIMSVRDLAYDLRPIGLDQIGLVRSVHEYCEEFSDKNQVKVDFFASGIDELRLDFDTKITLYRLIQESLNNVRQHADASQVTIRLVASFPSIILRIEDNGKGFDVEDRLGSAAKDRRMGLRTMEERVALLQGEMRIESRLTEGTKIFIEVPDRGENNGK